LLLPPTAAMMSAQKRDAKAYLVAYRDGRVRIDLMSGKGDRAAVRDRLCFCAAEWIVIVIEMF